MKFLRYILFIFLPVCSHAQLIPLNHWYEREAQSLSSGDSVNFTAVRPMLLTKAMRAAPTWMVHSLNLPPKDSTKASFFNRHLLQYREEGLALFLDPVLTLTAGQSSGHGRTWESDRGLRLGVRAGKNIFISSRFVESQARFPGWMDSAIRQNQLVVPGKGKGRNFHNGAFDYAQSTATIAWEASPHFEAVMGYGKNFLGDGYRSLLLSDNAANYPYLRLQARFRRLHYTVWYNQLTNPRYSIGGRYQRKFSTLHYAEVNLGKRWQLGLFEAVVWQAKDSLQDRGFELHYLNPVLFLRPVEFAQGSPDNSLFGLTGKYQASRHTYLYTQLMLDDFNFQQTKKSGEQHLNNKYGVQLGMYTMEPLGAQGLHYRLEFNAVRPYSYGHRKPMQNYSHYNQALAHPLGANFYELVNRATWSKGRWYAGVYSTVAVIGRDYDGYHYGSDLWGGEAGLPMLGHKMLQGLRTNLSYTSVEGGWLLSPAMNVRLQVRAGRRVMRNREGRQAEGFFGVGVVTGFGNRYEDF